MEHAVDPDPDLQPAVGGLDVDVGGADLQGVLEDALQQPHHRGVLGRPGAGQLADVDRLAAQLLGQTAGELADLIGPAIDRVDELSDRALGRHRQIDRLFQDAHDLVVGEQVGGIGHGHQHAAVAVFQHHGPEAPGRLLGQQAHHIGFDLDAAQIDVGDVHLMGDRQRDLFLAGIAVLDQHPPQFAPAFPLALEGVGQLGL